MSDQPETVTVPREPTPEMIEAACIAMGDTPATVLGTWKVLYAELYRAMISQAPAAGGWGLIKTAPKDGTRILAYNPMVGVYSTGWTTSWPGSSEVYEGFPCGHWDFLGAWDCVPTRWRALPPPPSNLDGKEA